MPELPEVEVLVRNLEPLLQGREITHVQVRRPRIVRPSAERPFGAKLEGARFIGLARRAKYLIFSLRDSGGGPLTLLGHLGMTGRMYVQPSGGAFPRHAAVVMNLDQGDFVFEDPRYFGRLSFDLSPLAKLGPEPLGPDFTPAYLKEACKRSRQPIKVKLLDQGLVAGVGNIYAGEALFRAGISPRSPACSLSLVRATRLWKTLREVLQEAIGFGSSLALDLSGRNDPERLFYYGAAPETSPSAEERWTVYGREDLPCTQCGGRIRRMVQAARSTFYCPRCQR